MRIRTRVFIQFLFPILAIYAVLIGGAIRYLGDSYRGDAINQKRAAMENLSRGLDDWLLSRISEVLQLSRIPLFKSGSDDEILAYMTSWRDTLSFLYDDLYLVEPDGKWVSVSGRNGILADAEYVEIFFDEGQLFTYAGPHRYLGDIFSRHFVIGAPLYNHNGELSRVLTATISLEKLTRIFGFFSFEDFDSWMIVNPDGKVIIHENPSFSGRSEKEAYGRSFMADGTWAENETFISFMRNGWKMVTFISTDALMAPFRQAYTLVIGLASVLVFFVIFIVLFLSAAVSRPINRLTEGVHLIMSGDYSRRIESYTSDELADLADSFNRLATRMTTLRTDDRFSFLGHVAARMAHELRRPLHVIQLAAKALEKNENEKTRYLRIIDEEIEAADRFVGEILSFSHDESLERQLFSPESLISRVADKYRLLAQEDSILITTESLCAIPELYIDVMRLEEVFSNILQNSLDAITESTPPDTLRKIRVTIDRNSDREVRIRVNDSGPGFDETILDKLFDPYFTTRDKGTGLGLSLSYRILMAHGARISLENDEKGHGQVTMVFPV